LLLIVAAFLQNRLDAWPQGRFLERACLIFPPPDFAGDHSLYLGEFLVEGLIIELGLVQRDDQAGFGKSRLNSLSVLVG
jgi:hypothetical protein